MNLSLYILLATHGRGTFFEGSFTSIYVLGIY